MGTRNTPSAPHAGPDARGPRASRRRVLQLGAALSAFAAAGRPIEALAQNTGRIGAPLGAGADSRTVTRIAFGSCADQVKDQPIWGPIVGELPDLFVFLGDNVYADTTDMVEMRAAYDKLAAKPGYQALQATTSVVATWDDHDYGENDAGRNYPKKEAAKQIFLDFFGEPAGSARRTRDDGVYTAYTFGPAGRRVQLILLDVRWNRSPQNRVSDAVYENERKPKNMGPYAPTEDPAQTMLGERQWAWLKARLEEPADLRIVATSLSFLMDFTGWETWANYPQERQRMLDLISQTGARGVMFISGDTHWAEMSRLAEGTPYPLWDVTSSGLTESWEKVSPNRNRVTATTYQNNYGMLRIDWDAPQPRVTMEIRDVEGMLIFQNSVALESLQA
jgi:alkaline phosphatase D